MPGLKRPPRVTVNDLIDESGRFKRPEDLPRRVRRELLSYSVDGQGRIKAFRFRPLRTGIKVIAPRQYTRKRVTKAMERELERRLLEEIAQLQAARLNGAQTHPAGRTR